MLRLFLSLLVCLVAACSNQESPSAAMPEVNDANCHPDAIKSMAEATRKKFAGLCLRRGSLGKGSDQGLRP